MAVCCYGHLGALLALVGWGRGYYSCYLAFAIVAADLDYFSCNKESAGFEEKYEIMNFLLIYEQTYCSTY